MMLLHLMGVHIIMGAARFEFQQQQIIFRYMGGLYRPSIWVLISLDILPIKICTGKIYCDICCV